ncbi:hypothetical protein K438DRAFT_1765566 [Mycena galopus ATCC 62051]|nr:hypothetical protein K438DRAFT_1765566 [Mycena galopus ATCC 62051]
MTDAPEMCWLKSQIPRPAGWRTCPKNKEHHISMHVAIRSSHGSPPDVTRFGEQTVQHAATMQARKAAQKQQGPPTTKPAKKKARDDNAIGKGKGRNDVLSAGARSPATVIRTPPSAISSTTSTPASVIARSTLAVVPVAPVEDDKYDPDLFQISTAETRELQVAVYTDHHQPALEFRVNVRGLHHFDFTSFDAAKIVGAVPDSETGRPAAHYVWYSALEDKWLRVGPAVSLRGRGSYMILWNVSVPEDACPGLLDLVTNALHSILDEAVDLDVDDLFYDTSDWGCSADADLTTEDGQNSDFGWDVSVPSSPSLASSSPLKRKWTSDSEEEGPRVEAEEDVKRQRLESKYSFLELDHEKTRVAWKEAPVPPTTLPAPLPFTMTGPIHNARTALPRDVFIDQLRVRAKQRAQPRFDVNATATVEDCTLAICFTMKQLEDMATRNPGIVGLPCKNCNLPIALWGLGCISEPEPGHCIGRVVVQDRVFGTNTPPQLRQRTNAPPRRGHPLRERGEKLRGIAWEDACRHDCGKRSGTHRPGRDTVGGDNFVNDEGSHHFGLRIWWRGVSLWKWRGEFDGGRRSPVDPKPADSTKGAETDERAQTVAGTDTTERDEPNGRGDGRDGDEPSGHEDRRDGDEPKVSGALEERDERRIWVKPFVQWHEENEQENPKFFGRRRAKRVWIEECGPRGLDNGKESGFARAEDRRVPALLVQWLARMFSPAANFITVLVAIKEAPPGRQHVRRPNMRAEVREDLHCLFRRRGLAWNDLWKLKQEGISNSKPYGLYDEDLKKIARQMDEVLALQKDFRNTHLVNFCMPPPSPPAPITTLPPVQVDLRRIRVPKTSLAVLSGQATDLTFQPAVASALLGSWGLPRLGWLGGLAPNYDDGSGRKSLDDTLTVKVNRLPELSNVRVSGAGSQLIVNLRDTSTLIGLVFLIPLCLELDQVGSNFPIVAAIQQTEVVDLSDCANPMFNRHCDELQHCAPLRKMFAMVNQATVTGIRDTLTANMRQGQVSQVGLTDEFRMICLVVKTPDDFLAVAFGVCRTLSVHVDSFAHFDVEVVELLVVGDGQRVFQDVLVQPDVDIDVPGLLEIGTQIQQNIGYRMQFLPRHLRTEETNRYGAEGSQRDVGGSRDWKGERKKGTHRCVDHRIRTGSLDQSEFQSEGGLGEVGTTNKSKVAESSRAKESSRERSRDGKVTRRVVEIRVGKTKSGKVGGVELGGTKKVGTTYRGVDNTGRLRGLGEMKREVQVL